MGFGIIDSGEELRWHYKGRNIQKGGKRRAERREREREKHHSQLEGRDEPVLKSPLQSHFFKVLLLPNIPILSTKFLTHEPCDISHI